MAEKKRGRGKKPSFGEAVTEVEEILTRLEGEEIDIDDLSREVKRAVELIKLCRSKLEKTDREVRELVADIQPAAAGGQDGGEPEGAASGVEEDDENADLPF